jgi:general secretion pathway protein J
MVVAASVFAVLSVVSYTAITGVLNGRNVVEEKRSEMVALQRAYGLLKNDLRYALPRSVRDELGDFEQALLIDENDELLRLTTQYPSIGSSSNIKRVVWEVKEGGLWRNHYVVLDRTEGTEIVRRKILNDIAETNVYAYSFVSDESNLGSVEKTTSWEDKEYLPLAIEVQVEMKNAKTFQWLFEMPGK